MFVLHVRAPCNQEGVGALLGCEEACLLIESHLCLCLPDEFCKCQQVAKRGEDQQPARRRKCQGDLPCLSRSRRPCPPPPGWNAPHIPAPLFHLCRGAVGRGARSSSCGTACNSRGFLERRVSCFSAFVQLTQNTSRPPNNCNQLQTTVLPKGPCCFSPQLVCVLMQPVILEGKWRRATLRGLGQHRHY